MLSSIHRHPSSYRDPSGFLFYSEGTLYRQVNQFFKEDFDQFINGGLYENLVRKDILIPHKTINQNLTDSGEWYQTLQPEFIPFISYPYEWCFDQLKDAALITLEAAKEAMNFGMMLKDASAYNVQWHKGRMMFIDTLSFEKYDEQKPWVAYRQFCEHFFAPLALMHNLKLPLEDLFLAHPDGIPLPFAKKLLPFKSKLNLHSYLHLHLQASILVKKQKETQKAKAFSREKMKNLFRSLEDGIQSFSFSERSGVWSGYYEEAHQRENYISDKKQIITGWTKNLSVNTVLDAGANEGEFSELLQSDGRFIISADFDHYSVNKFYNNLKKARITRILPLFIDFANPSPAIGINNQERSSFLNRTKVDLVLALALIHHLCIGRNIPFESMAEMFQQLGNYLIIEFIPKHDEKIQLMLKQKKDVYHYYNEENFLIAFGNRFSIIDKRQAGQSGRTLYFLKRKS